ncbi:MAG: hydroxymethylglutaryl-CoA synthase, partial [Chloroflexota bacterium]|nr:hydroxymethylglutaryl-CoA synthase [Chloroflexota bacterium]
YTAGAGGGAYLMGPAEEAIAVLEGSYSYVSDTPDFWRREHQTYPSHGNRFTSEPAYFTHVIGATTTLLEEMNLAAEDFAAAVFHQPNAKFPEKAARRLGFLSEQIRVGLLAPLIGNCYAGASPLGLTRVLDEAQPGDRVLVVSFGSGAGSDALVYRVTDRIQEARDRAPHTQHYLDRKQYIDYATYARWRGKIK